MKYLPGFIEHLHLLLGIVVIRKDIYLRDNVICELICKLVDCHLFSVHYLTILFLEFCHSLSARTRSRLVTCHMNIGNMGEILYWLKHYDHHDGRAVRVGDNTPRTHKSIGGVTLRHHKRHILIHTECT